MKRLQSVGRSFNLRDTEYLQHRITFPEKGIYIVVTYFLTGSLNYYNTDKIQRQWDIASAQNAQVDELIHGNTQIDQNHQLFQDGRYSDFWVDRLCASEDNATITLIAQGGTISNEVRRGYVCSLGVFGICDAAPTIT